MAFVRWSDEGYAPIIMDPFLETYEGINYYRIYCGRYILYIKVDRRRTSETFRPRQLGEHKQLFVLARELKKSKEWLFLQKLALKSVR